MEGKEEKKRRFKFLEGVKLPTLSGLPVKRFAIVGGLILVALIAGIVVGEIGLVGQAAGAAKVWITGRLPLREWELRFPASFLPVSRTWISARSEEHVATLQCFVGHPEEGVAAEALELELGFQSGVLSGERDLRLTVKVYYTAGALEFSETECFTGQELAAIVRAAGGGQVAKMRILLDPERLVESVVLEVESGSPRALTIEIERAELILR